MKGKETVTVVCSHCGQPHEVEKKDVFLYQEEWMDSRPRSHVNPFTKQVLRYNPYNLSEEEWKAAEPKRNLHQFLIELNDRVARIEAALAQKGGTK